MVLSCNVFLCGGQDRICYRSHRQDQGRPHLGQGGGAHAHEEHERSTYTRSVPMTTVVAAWHKHVHLGGPHGPISLASSPSSHPSDSRSGKYHSLNFFHSGGSVSGSGREAGLHLESQTRHL